MPSDRTCPATRLRTAGAATLVGLPHEGQYVWVSFIGVPHWSQNIFGLLEASSHYHTPSSGFCSTRQVEMLRRFCCDGSSEDPSRSNPRVAGASPALARCVAGYPGALYRRRPRIRSWPARQAIPAGRAATPVQSLALGRSFAGSGSARCRGRGGYRTLAPDGRLPGAGRALPRAGRRRRSRGDSRGGPGAGILCTVDTHGGHVESAGRWSLWRGRCAGWRLDGCAGRRRGGVCRGRGGRAQRHGGRRAAALDAGHAKANALAQEMRPLFRWERQQSPDLIAQGEIALFLESFQHGFPSDPRILQAAGAAPWIPASPNCTCNSIARHYPAGAGAQTRSAMARFKLSMPWPVTLEISKNARPRCLARSRKRATRSGSWAASILVATTIMGLAAKSSLKLASSSITVSKSCTGSRPVVSETSTR